MNKTSTSSRVTFQDREEMFQAYQESRTIARVVALCGVHSKTAKRWRRLDKWDQRCDEIEKKLRKKMERKIVNRRLRNVKILDTAIEGIAEELEGGTKLEPKLLPRLVMTQDLLIGRGAADEEQPTITDETKKALAKLAELGEEGLRLLGDKLAEAIPDNGDSQRLEPGEIGMLEDKYVIAKGGNVKRKPKGGFGNQRAKKAKNL